MRNCLFILLALTLSNLVYAGRISGTVTDNKGNPLPFASILVKGTTIGTTANNTGEYFLNLSPGEYSIVCQYVGYQRVEKSITIGNDATILNFTLVLQELTLDEVVIRAGAEDPAYAIIRNAIKKRPEYEEPLDAYTCEAYIKTLFKTRSLPDRLFGKKIEPDAKKEMGVDSTGKGILYLSESLTKIAFQKPDDMKLEVLSGRASGSNGFGFNFPAFINFYNNNINVFMSQFNPRGFISPISDGALNFYRYKYLGSFIEDGREVNKIEVIPRRTFEPLFSGTINIIEGEWRIHSLDMLLVKESQLEILDTVKISQIHVPIAPGIWRTKDQVVYFTVKQFGIDATGNFLNVYSKYDLAPVFPKNYFNNVVMTYDTAVNKRSKVYWDSIRPVQLEPEEVKDYTIKDSSFQVRLDSAMSQRNLDSLRKKQGNIKVGEVLLSGFNRSNYRANNMLYFSWEPILRNITYNTVEGIVTNITGSIRKPLKGFRKQLVFTPLIRYGFSNGHLNPSASVRLQNSFFSWDEQGGSSGRYTLEASGGKRVSQFNRDNPIGPLQNSIATLLYERNYMKIYENVFGQIAYTNRTDNGFRYSANAVFENRLPINNTTDFTFFDRDHKVFTPNYPTEKLPQQFLQHQAFSVNMTVEYTPGQKYIQYPRRKMAIGSKYPTFSIYYEKGLKDILGSDVNYDKWKLSVWDNLNLKLKGLFRYRLSVGGFLNDRQVFIQDFQHFNGNRLLYAGDYLNSFQLAPYYANSTTASLYGVAHVEHHFNGLLTNKIPLFRRLNWHLVGASNAFYVSSNNNYFEVSAGLENIFKILRVDFVASYLNGRKGEVGIRLGFGGLLGSTVQVQRR